MDMYFKIFFKKCQPKLSTEHNKIPLTNSLHKAIHTFSYKVTTKFPVPKLWVNSAQLENHSAGKLFKPTSTTTTSQLGCFHVQEKMQEWSWCAWSTRVGEVATSFGRKQLGMFLHSGWRTINGDVFEVSPSSALLIRKNACLWRKASRKWGIAAINLRSL